MANGSSVKRTSLRSVESLSDCNSVTDRQTELLQHIPHLDATYHVIKNGKTAQLLLTVRTVNGNHIGGKSSVEPVDNQFQQ